MKNNITLPEPEKRRLRTTPLGQLFEYRIHGEISKNTSKKAFSVGEYSIRYPYIASEDKRIAKFNRFCEKTASNYAFYAINRMRYRKGEKLTAILLFHLEFQNSRLFVSIRGYNGDVSDYTMVEFRRLYFSLPDMRLIKVPLNKS